jgi:hypothetical protein
VRRFLRGTPTAIIPVGLGLMAWGFLATYLVLSAAWGGFLYAPTIEQVIVFGVTGGVFVAGLVITLIGCYRHFRPYGSN